MAPVSRRPGTRGHPSSTQDDVAEEDTYPPVAFDDQNDYSMNHGNIPNDLHRGSSMLVDEYRPQCDNPSQMQHGDDDDVDFALEEYIGSQILEEEEPQQPTSYTQNTLDAASVLAGGFGNSNSHHSAARASRPCPPLLPQRSFRRSEIEEEDSLDCDEDEEALPLKDRIAKQLHKDGLDLPAEERQFIEECEEGANSTKYNKTKERLLHRCLETIRKHGGPIARLAKNKVPNTNHPSQESPIDYELFEVCGGDKDASKHKILNDVFTLCGMKWDCRSGANKGEALAPRSFNKMMQQLSYVFLSKGIRYEYNKDFNDTGEFHGVIKKKWQEIRKERPTFGTGEQKARVEHTLFRKFIQAISDKAIRPYEDPEHLLICVIFILGFCCGLRGSSEHINLKAEDFYVGEYTIEDGSELAGLRWFGVKVPWSKTSQLNLKNTVLPRDKDVVLTVVEDPQHPCWDPWKIICFYIAHTHPKAKKFYGRLVKQGSQCEGGKLQKAFGYPIWFAESGEGRANWNLGPTKHRELCKEIAKLSGVEKWEQCTGHALRALCVTHCVGSNMTAAEVATKVRHASITSQKTYATESNKRKANRMSAMNPSGKLSRPDNDTKKQKVSEILPEDAVVIETQPLLPENRHKFAHMARDRQPLLEASVHEEEKENTIVSVRDEIDIKMEKLKRENQMLRLEQENQRLRQTLYPTHRPTPPPTHRQSYPPMYPPRRQEHHGPPPSFVGPPPPSHYPGYHSRFENRRSYPPAYSHPQTHPGHGGYEEEPPPPPEEYGDHYGGYGGDYHRRY